LQDVSGGATRRRPTVPSAWLAPAGPTADSPATGRQAPGSIRTASIRSRRPVRLGSRCPPVRGISSWPAADTRWAVPRRVTGDSAVSWSPAG